MLRRGAAGHLTCTKGCFHSSQLESGTTSVVIASRQLRHLRRASWRRTAGKAPQAPRIYAPPSEAPPLPPRLEKYARSRWTDAGEVLLRWNGQVMEPAGVWCGFTSTGPLNGSEFMVRTMHVRPGTCKAGCVGSKHTEGGRSSCGLAPARARDGSPPHPSLPLSPPAVQTSLVPGCSPCPSHPLPTLPPLCTVCPSPHPDLLYLHGRNPLVPDGNEYIITGDSGQARGGGGGGGGGGQRRPSSGAGCCNTALMPFNSRGAGGRRDAPPPTGPPPTPSAPRPRLQGMTGGTIGGIVCADLILGKALARAWPGKLKGALSERRATRQSCTACSVSERAPPPPLAVKQQQQQQVTRPPPPTQHTPTHPPPPPPPPPPSSPRRRRLVQAGGTLGLKCTTPRVRRPSNRCRRWVHGSPRRAVPCAPPGRVQRRRLPAFLPSGRCRPCTPRCGTPSALLPLARVPLQIVEEGGRRRLLSSLPLFAADPQGCPSLPLPPISTLRCVRGRRGGHRFHC